ncbi:unnamed protein product [Paramecium pentaurelia]|uniref:FPL domain-containing protein n=1 Tax=Paramecium pentaurelia TaxID=43138 RepID=A0A8S1X5T3_9CILI|nr:unnamed protein product [Paramecium pentaurelia]
MKKFLNYLKTSTTEQQEPITQNQSDQEHFLILVSDLIKYQNEPTNPTKIIPVIKQIILYAIKGDNELHKQLFEQFMEIDILNRLYDILQRRLCHHQLIQEIFEQVSSLLINVKEITNKNYILSHSSISNMVLWKHSFEQYQPNIEIVETYISFLNLLAVKLDDITTMFFINLKYPQFPLLWNAIRFYNHPELMVRNKSRSIVLHILNIKNQNIIAYTNSFPFLQYYFNLGNQVLLTIKQINVIVEKIKWRFEGQQQEQLTTLSEELKEQLQYIHDLFTNNQYLEQLILDYAIQRPIIQLSQVIKFGYQHFHIAVALQAFLLFLLYFRTNAKIIQYIYYVFLSQDKSKIIINEDLWGYSNAYDNDQNFIKKLCLQIYQTLQPIDLSDLKHENLEIKMSLQQLKQVDCIILQQIIESEILMQESQVLNSIYQHCSNKEVLIYVLLFMKELANPQNIQSYYQNILKFALEQDQQLIVSILSLDIIYAFKQSLDPQNYILQLYQQILAELILNIKTSQLFLDQLIDIFKKKFLPIKREFIIDQQINVHQEKYAILFDPYSSLAKIQKLEYCIILSQHQIFENLPNINEQYPELTKLAVPIYQIGDKPNCTKIACQYSETGHFYNMETYFILNVDNFLHVVQLDEQGVIVDVICSKLWQLLQVYGIERVQVLQFTYFDFSKFYLRLQNFDDVKYIDSLASQQQQQFGDWFKQLLIQKLEKLQQENQVIIK